MKRFKITILVFVLVTSLFQTAVFAESSTNEGASDSDTFSIVAYKNNEFMINVLTKSKGNASKGEMRGILSNSKDSYLDITLKANGDMLSNDYVPFTAVGNIVVDDTNYTINFEGELFPSTSDKGDTVYIGGLDGYVGTPQENNAATLSVHYSPTTDKAFFSLTIGYVGGDQIPTILFFGDSNDKGLKSAALKKHSLDKEMRQKEKADRKNKEETLSSTMEITTDGVDGNIRLQDVGYASTSKGDVAAVSVYFANELRNQGYTTVSAKVNSNTDNMDEYVDDNLGYSSPVTYPDKVNVELVSSNDHLHSTRTVSPEEGSEEINFPIYAYIPYAGLGWQSFNLKITMSDTDVSFRQKVGGEMFNYHIVEWDIYERNGWALDDIDYSTEYPEAEDNGIRVQSGYTYEGSVYSDTTATMGAIGKVRYEIYSGGLFTHIWTNEAVAASHFTIKP